MSNLHRMAALLTLLLVIGAASSAENLLPISVLDNNGQAAEMTEFVADGDNAWWARLPEDSSFDNLVLMIEGDDPSGFFPASGSVVSIPDAGEMIENAGYIVIAQYDDDGTEKERMRLYASHAPYAPVQEKSYRSMRAAGQWGRINGTAILKTDPETADEEAGRLDAGTRVFVLFTCQVKNKEYACIRFAEDTFYIARNNVRFLTDTANVSFEAQFLRENEMSEEYRIVKTMYNAKIRDTIGTSSDAVVETAPLNTILLVLAQVSWDNRLYDLVYRFDNGVIGFVHDSQMKDLSEEESAEALAGTDEDTAAFAGTVGSATPLLMFPDKNAEAYGILDEGTELTVYVSVQTLSGDYSLVSCGEQLGYILSDDILTGNMSVGSQESVTVESTAKQEDALYGTMYEVAVHEAVLYNEASCASTANARVQEGDILSCLEKDGEWLKLTLTDGSAGWLPKDFALQVRLGYGMEDEIE